MEEKSASETLESFYFEKLDSSFPEKTTKVYHSRKV